MTLKPRFFFSGERINLLRFLIKQRLVGFDVPLTPHFDSEESTSWFSSKLANSKGYLEYGSGGSTYLAAKIGIPFVTVDSDRFFLASVKKKITQDNLMNTKTQTYHYANIGLTGFWGQPLLQRRMTPERTEMFRRYSDPPAKSTPGTFIPDLVLVDGRFRVACALKMLKFFANQKGGTLVVDDYVGRQPYHVIEAFAKVERYVGRMAVFTELGNFDKDELDTYIRRYEVIPD